MPYFDQKHDPLGQLTPLLDPDPNKDSHNVFAIDLRSLTPEKSPLQLLHIETRLLLSIFSLRLISCQKQLGHPSLAPYSGYYQSCLLIG